MATATATLCLMGTQLPLPEGAQPPIFGPCPLWPNGWLDQNAQSPQIYGHVCCGPVAGLIKMPLSTEVGLGPGDLVLDEDPASP